MNETNTGVITTKTTISKSIDDMSLQEIIAAAESRKAEAGAPLYEEHSRNEARNKEIREQLRKMNLPVPSRIIIDVEKEHQDAMLIALLTSKGKGRSISELEIATTYSAARINAVRDALTSIKPPLISEKKHGRGAATIITLTAEGAAEAAKVAASEVGQLELQAQAQRQATAS